MQSRGWETGRGSFLTTIAFRFLRINDRLKDVII